MVSTAEGAAAAQTAAPHPLRSDEAIGNLITMTEQHIDTADSTHSVRITRTHLADGRDLIYFDDDPQFVSGEKTRSLVDTRELPQAHTESIMRRDPLTGEWSVFAAHRMNRTFMPPANENPLAPTKPGEIPTEVPADDYNVVVFENRFPSFSLTCGDAGEHWADGIELFAQAPARARCEVVCFTPEVSNSFKDLTLGRARTVVEAWAHRTRELSELDCVAQVFPFENRGEEIGVTLQHPHGQIYTYPYLPPRTQAILRQSREYRDRTGGDLCADVLAAEKQAGTRIVAETEHFTAFVPAAAKWPLELMIMPNRDVKDFAGLTDAEKDDLTALYLDMLARVDNFFDGVEKTPYIAAWNQAPCTAGKDLSRFGIIGDERDFMRFHLQLFSLMRSPGRMKFLAGSESAMAAWINDTTPERIAARLLEVDGRKEK